MPTEMIDPPRRNRIRAALAAHIMLFRTTPGRIAAFIADHKEALGGTIHADTIKRFLDTTPGSITVRPEYVALLDRYLKMMTPPADDPPEGAATAATSNIPVDLSPSPEAELSSGLIRFYSQGSETKPFHDVDDIRERLEGQFIMYRPIYRPAWRLGVETGFILTSLIEIVNVTGAESIFETQNLPEVGPEAPYHQRDGGFLFTFGNFIYFLTKEKNKGTSVKLGVIEKFLQSGLSKNIGNFQGRLYVSSNTSRYPAAKFFCRRVVGGKIDPMEFVSDYKHPDEIADRAAIAHIFDDA
jgi:hypothetical protein